MLLVSGSASNVQVDLRKYFCFQHTQETAATLEPERRSRQILGQMRPLGPSDSQIENWQSVFNRKNPTEQSLVQQQQQLLRYTAVMLRFTSIIVPIDALDCDNVSANQNRFDALSPCLSCRRAFCLFSSSCGAQVRVRNLTYMQPFSPVLVVAHTSVSAVCVF